MPKIKKSLEVKNGKFHLSLAVSAKQLAVDPAAKTISGIQLMQIGEWKGHGVYGDAKTMQTVVDAVAAGGGQLRGYYTHDHRAGWSGDFMSAFEEAGSELAIPGFFSDIALNSTGDQVVAGSFSFYDTFAEYHPEQVAQILEMAAKTPRLISISLELGGYAVFVGTDGVEYTAEPDEVELMYDGMPVARVTDVWGSAFVAAGAATDGLFAKLSRKVRGEELDPETVAQLKTIFADFAAELETRNQENKDMNLIKALKAAITDKARLNRALAIVADSEDPEKLTVASVTAQLDAEDAATAALSATATAKKVADLEAQLATANKAKADAEASLAAVKSLGIEKPLDLGGPGASGGRQLTGLSAKLAPVYAKKGINLAIATVSDMIVPEIWIQNQADEPQVEQPTLMTSPVVATSPLFSQIASGAGTSAQIPFFKEPRFLDEIQVESTAPSYNSIAQIKAVAPILNRVSAFGASAMAASVSGTDPVSKCLSYRNNLRNYQRQATLRSLLYGAFGSHTDTTGALNAVRKNVCTTTGSIDSDTNLISLSIIRLAAALLNENWANLSALFVHPDILAELSDQDVTDYITPSEGILFLKGYRGCTIYTDTNLKTTATINGVANVPIYRSYLMSARSLAIGDKPQSTMVGDTASITTEALASINDVKVFDRTRFVFGLNGLSWKGTPAGQSATNAELATIANWELAKNGSETFDPRNVGIAEIVSNG